MMEPTPEQFAEWLQQALNTYHLQYAPGTHGENKVGHVASEVARLAYAAGADAELEECNKYLYEHAAPNRPALLAARRPKPPSLKQRALNAFYSRRSEPQYYRDADGNEALICPDLYADMELIEKALKALPGD